MVAISVEVSVGRHNLRFIILIGSRLLAAARFSAIAVGSLIEDVHYFGLAENLAERQGCRLVSYPLAPAEDVFPLGRPLALPPLAAVAAGNLLSPRLLVFAFVDLVADKTRLNGCAAVEFAAKRIGKVGKLSNARPKFISAYFVSPYQAG